MLHKESVLKIVGRLILLSLIFVGVGQSIAQTPQQANGVQIRVVNTGDIPFSEVSVRYLSEQESYGALAVGTTSEYREFEFAYRNPAVIVVAEGQTYKVFPIDYMGEKRLPAGFYTYSIYIRDGGLSYDFRESSN